MTALRHVAALYDIHGNLPALEAVLAEIAKEQVDLIVIGGDVFPGPMGVEVMLLLSSLETPVTYIRGNGDRETLAARAGAVSATLPPPVQEVMRWCASTMTEPIAERVQQWPATTTLAVDGLGDVLFCHATPLDDTTIVTKRTSDADVTQHFGGASARTVVCGHTHMPYDRQIGNMRIVNAGSVGMPFADPGAYWLMLGPGVELRKTPYDFSAAALRIEQSDYPEAATFAATSITHPPSEAAMLDRFTALT